MRGKKIKMREMRSRLIFGACTVISGAVRNERTVGDGGGKCRRRGGCE